MSNLIDDTDTSEIDVEEEIRKELEKLDNLELVTILINIYH